MKNDFRDIMDQIKFFQLNICGLSDRSITCLEKYAYDFDADFIFLSETKVGADVPNQKL